jgi:hypothetical protein
MTTFVFANNINTTLASPVSSGATSITLASAAHLPASIPAGEYLAITLQDAATRLNFEIVYATAVSGSTLTVVRAQEGTAALSWLTGDYVFSGPTAGQMESFASSGFINPMTTEGDIIVGTTGGTAVRLAAGTSGYVLTTNGSGALPVWAPGGGGGSSGVTSFNTRTGAVTLSYGDVTTALGYVPYSVNGGTVSGSMTVTGTATFNSTVTATGQVSTAANFALPSTWTLNGGSSFTVNYSGAAQLTLSSTGALVATGTVRGGSDARVKVNVKPIANALHAVRYGLRGVEYDRTDTGEHEAGFIAQDVKRELPALVGVSEQGGFTDFHSMDYMHATAYLAAAVTELHDLVLSLKQRIEALES